MAIGDGVSAIAQLAMTFGGFSPTAMDGVAATKEHIAHAEETAARRREAELRRREIESARASTPKRFTDDEGMTWTYVVMDDSFIRIESCKREQKRVAIPREIDGLPVRALGSDIFHESDVVEEIDCPDSIELIAACAFRQIQNLRRVRFPFNVATFSGSWLQHCVSLEEMVLPGLLDEITPSIFDNVSLRKLTIGPHVANVKAGACERTQLDEVSLVGNPFIWCDGDALYSSDKRECIAVIRPVEHLEVVDGCKRIARKCSMGIATLKSVSLPESLEIIDEYGFAHTGLKDIALPGNVTEISTRAFFHCSNLKRIELNDGLKAIGDYAFAESGLEKIRIPASIERIGNSITENSAVVHSGPACTFEISEDSRSLSFDGEGGLYREEEDGKHFIQLVDQEARAYRVTEGTCFIDEYAFAFHDSIESVTLSEGVREIRKNAFRICRKLKNVAIPESLESIGAEAFLDTELESLYLPAGFRELSDDALVTAGAHRLGNPPSLREIRVSPDNETFYVESGLLCRRGKDGDRGIVFNDNTPDVRIPDAVTTVAAFAFSNARNVKTFSIGPNLKTIGTSGFSTWCSIETIHIELPEPLEGRSVFDIAFPDTARTPHEISISLGGSSWVNVPDIIRHYDNCIAHAHDYNARESDGVSAYEQVKLIIARLNDPIMLTDFNRSVFERTIREHLAEICVDVARHDDREVINDLFDLGALNEGNLEMIIAEVGRLQDAAMTGYLLEQKRVRFKRQAIDYDL